MIERWLVVGGGKSGLGAARLARAKGCAVTVSDVREPDAEVRSQLTAHGITLAVGPQTPALLSSDISTLVLSPGVNPRIPLVAAAKARGVNVISEIEFALQSFRGTVIAVTGTNGKSTTCVMIGHILRRLGLSVSEGGNLGDPPTLMIAEGRIGTYLVLELSSYQLELAMNVRPRVAIFTSFSHDHIDRHGTFAAYFAAKWHLIESMEPGTLLITKREIWEQAQHWKLNLPKGVALQLVGEGLTHNQINVAFAVTAVAHLKPTSLTELERLLDDFTPLPYRCQNVGSVAGHPVINDSKSTNVEATLVALAATSGPCHLLVGGKGKDESYRPLAAYKDRILSCSCFGASGPEIYADVKGDLPAALFPTLAEALNGLPPLVLGTPGPILFSPACASFDEFKNFEHRGAFFTTRIKELFGI